MLSGTDSRVLAFKRYSAIYVLVDCPPSMRPCVRRMHGHARLRLAKGSKKPSSLKNNPPKKHVTTNYIGELLTLLQMYVALSLTVEEAEQAILVRIPMWPTRSLSPPQRTLFCLCLHRLFCIYLTEAYFISNENYWSQEPR